MVLPSSWTAKSDAGSPIICHLVFKILTCIGASGSLQSWSWQSARQGVLLYDRLCQTVEWQVSQVDSSIRISCILPPVILGCNATNKGKQVHADDEDLMSSSEELARAASGVAMDRASTHCIGMAVLPPSRKRSQPRIQWDRDRDAVNELNWFRESL